MYGGVSASRGSLLQVCAGVCADGEGEMEMEETTEKEMAGGEETWRRKKRTRGRLLSRARALRLLRSSKTR